MRFIVWGAGAVGSVIGGYLAKAGFEVVFVSRPGPHTDAIRRDGLTVRGLEATWTLPVRVVTDVGALEIGATDVLLIAVKSFQVEAVMEELRGRIAREVPVFCAQNGVRNEEIAARFFHNVHGVLVAVGATRLTPGVVTHTMRGCLGIGTHPTGLSAVAQRVIRALANAGLTAQPTQHIMRVKWHKLLENLNNATAGLIGASAHDIRVHEEIRGWMADVWEEGTRVLNAAGIEYEALPGLPSIADRIDEYRRSGSGVLGPGERELEHYSSLYQDLYHRQGEVEARFLNGEVVAFGSQLNMRTPYNGVLLELVNDLAAKRERPGKYTIRELRNRVEAA